MFTLDDIWLDNLTLKVDLNSFFLGAQLTNYRKINDYTAANRYYQKIFAQKIGEWEYFQQFETEYIELKQELIASLNNP